MWYAAAHAARLCRDARALGASDLTPERAGAALARAAQTAFATSAGVLRADVVRKDGRAEIEIRARPLPRDAFRWHARTATFPHQPAGGALGVKTSGVKTLGVKSARAPVLERARSRRRPGAGVDEWLLFDRAGRLVEGSISGLVVVDAAGRSCTPPRARGGVRSIALGLARARGARLIERDLRRADLASARELIALNAVRGARAIVSLDGEPVGRGQPGPVARALAACLRAP